MKLSTIFENSQRLAITAAEEAHRFGHPAVDVEHLFLALLISQTDAGKLLRSRGIGLDEARQAVRTEHAARLAALGISDVPMSPRANPAGGAGDIEWHERTLTLLSQSGGDGTGTALLRSLVADPGGFVAAVLERLDTDPALVLNAAEEADPGMAPHGPTGSIEERATPCCATYDAFIPAPPEQVWRLLDDPKRRPEWDNAIGPMETVGAGRWTGRAPAALATTRWRVPRRMEIRTVVLVAREEHHVLEWETSFPHTRPRRTEQTRIELREEPGGTRLRLTLYRPNARRVGATARFLAASELTRIATGISRAFRA
ncbi:SRPBCC family protein [Nocardioides aequoreus]|uniref:SRPBCC family protein n=1 Tax=Nocardioides aequoreus TaxID=397278 RepID=UPI0004C32970|nr:SRPBCC family protein [Nocardioides aequoreus]